MIATINNSQKRKYQMWTDVLSRVITFHTLNYNEHTYEYT